VYEIFHIFHQIVRAEEAGIGPDTDREKLDPGAKEKE
jgi:hypothetical protein